LRNVLTGAKEQVLLPVNSALHDLLSLLMEASPANVTTAFDTNHAPQGFLKTTWQRLGKVTIESGLFCFGVALKLGKFISSISRLGKGQY
jgi:hypothetical protein